MAVLLTLYALPSFTNSAAGATMLITLLGFPWAIAQWAPFSLVRRHMALVLPTHQRVSTARGSNTHDTRYRCWGTRRR